MKMIIDIITTILDGITRNGYEVSPVDEDTSQ